MTEGFFLLPGISYRAATRENLSSEVCEGQRRRLVSAFVIRLLENIISVLAMREISIF